MMSSVVSDKSPVAQRMIMDSACWRVDGKAVMPSSRFGDPFLRPCLRHFVVSSGVGVGCVRCFNGGFCGGSSSSPSGGGGDRSELAVTGRVLRLVLGWWCAAGSSVAPPRRRRPEPPELKEEGEPGAGPRPARHSDRWAQIGRAHV